MKNTELQQIAQQFISAANWFDTQSVLDLFTAHAVIEDGCVGDKFEHTEGIKNCFVTFFIGYHTSTRLLSLEYTGSDKILAKVGISVMRPAAWISVSMKRALSNILRRI